MNWTVAIVLVLGLGLGWMVVSFLFTRRALPPPPPPLLPSAADEIDIPDPMLSDSPVEHGDAPHGDRRP